MRIVLAALLAFTCMLVWVTTALAAGKPAPGGAAFFIRPLSAEQGQGAPGGVGAPLNVLAPSVAGTARDGSVLSASAGTWTGLAPIEFSYQWLRCDSNGAACNDVGPATSETAHLLIHEDVGHTLRVAVTATNSAGSASVTSAASAVVRALKPTNTKLPAISGSATVGQLLTVSEGGWEGTTPLSYSYQWQLCDAAGSACSEVPGATSSSYRVLASQLGGSLRAVTTASNSAGSSSATSAATASVQANGGGAVAWGENYYGGLGQIYRDTREESAIGIPELNDIVSVSTAGSVTLALLGNGELTSWGANAHGQLGNNGFKANWERGESHATVEELSGGKSVPLQGVTEAAAANEHALARIGSGPSSIVAAWGNNQYGTLGNGRGTFEVARVPRLVGSISGAKSIAVGGGSDYVVLEDGEVEAWGSNTSGQLSVEGWPAGDCDKRSTCVADHQKEYEEERSEVLCRVETGPELCSKIPRFVVDGQGRRIEHVKEVVAGREAAYALLESGEVLSWGENRVGQLGQGGSELGNHSSFSPPQKVTTSNGEALKGVVEIAAGNNHVLARLKNGQVLGWGDDSKGELGRPHGAPELCVPNAELQCFETAQPVAGLQPRDVAPATVEELAAGGQFSLALIGHKVYAFGRNGDGELGDGSWKGPESCLTRHEVERFKAKAIRDEEAAAEREAGKPAEREGAQKQLKAELRSLEKVEEHAGPCGRVPSLVKEGAGVVEHARAVAATSTHSVALLEPGVAAPTSPLLASSQLMVPSSHPAVSFRWHPQYVQRVDFRPFERPGEDEAEAEPVTGSCGEEVSEKSGKGSSEEACEEGDSGEATTGPLVDTTLPRVEHARESLKEGEKRTEYVLGQSLEAREGLWAGQGKITFEFQWERCSAYPRECVAIPAATSQTYSPVKADLEHTLRVTVTARSAAEPNGVTATSGETAVVKLEKGRSNGESISLSKGERESPEWTVAAFKEKPSEPSVPLRAGVGYEFKLTAGEKDLTTVVTAAE